MASEELKPCPFCGGPVELEQPISDRYRKFYGVVCRNTMNRGGTCAIEQRPSASKEAAIERWNRRAQDFEAMRQRVELLEALLLEVRQRCHLPDWARSRIDAALAQQVKP